MARARRDRPAGARRSFLASWWFWIPVFAAFIGLAQLPTPEEIAATPLTSRQVANGSLDGTDARPASGSPGGERDARDQTHQEEVWVQLGMDAVRARLRDPRSARFEGVFFHDSADGPPVTCGRVNSRNGLGGYSGPQRFVATNQSAFLEEEVEGDFSEVWAALCQ